MQIKKNSYRKIYNSDDAQKREVSTAKALFNVNKFFNIDDAKIIVVESIDDLLKKGNDNYSRAMMKVQAEEQLLNHLLIMNSNRAFFNKVTGSG